MKPCETCPFRQDAPHGFWHPAHYILIAYLGSIKCSAGNEAPAAMSCHQWGPGMGDPLPGEAQLCGGWTRAAPDALALTIASFRGSHIDQPDDIQVMDPLEMCRVNGIDVSRLPPLEWFPGLDGYETYGEWSEEVSALRSRLRDDPDSAHDLVLTGSPLDLKGLLLARRMGRRQPCPLCEAKAGERCDDMVKTRAGRKRWVDHPERMRWGGMGSTPVSLRCSQVEELSSGQNLVSMTWLGYAHRAGRTRL